MPHIHAAVIYVVTMCVLSYHTLNRWRLQQLDKVQASTPALHSLNLSRGHAELLLLLLLATTTS